MQFPHGRLPALKFHWQWRGQQYTDPALVHAYARNATALQRFRITAAGVQRYGAFVVVPGG
jgi:hypothetical protein